MTQAHGLVLTTNYIKVVRLWVVLCWYRVHVLLYGTQKGPIISYNTGYRSGLFAVL